MSGENVLNKFLSPGVGNDNILNLAGTWQIDGTAVTATADQLNSIDSIQTVANKSGSPIVAGALVYISGYDTTLDAPIVTLADADDAAKKATLVVTAVIADNASGTAESEATITGLDTSAYSAVGSLAYESATAGATTETAPTAADDDRRVVGVVKVKDASVGSIFYFPGKGGLEHAAVYLNNLTPGTVSASGAVVVDASKDIAGLNDVGLVNLDAGSSGVAGSVDVFPTTASKGKLSLTCTDQTGDTAVILNANAMGQGTTINIADPAVAAVFAVLSTAALTLAEVDLLDLSAQTETIDSGVAVSNAIRVTHIDNTTTGAGAVTLAAPDATMEGVIKVIEMTVDNGDVTLSLANVQGGSAATTCTWANVGEQLVLVGGASKWTVIGEGGVVLS